MRRAFLLLCVTILLWLMNASKASAANEVPAGSAEATVFTWRQLDDALLLPCPELDLPGSTPLAEVLDVCERELAAASSLPVQFIPDSAELSLEGIDSLNDVEVSDVFVTAGSHTFWDALELVFSQTLDDRNSPVPLTFVPQQGHILITTADQSDYLYVNRVYDIRSLETVFRRRAVRQSPAPQSQSPAPQSQGSGVGFFSVPATGQFGDKGFTGSRPSQTAYTQAFVDNFIVLVENQTGNDIEWVHTHGVGGSIAVFDGRIVVRHSYRIHREIEHLLRRLFHPDFTVVAGPAEQQSTVLSPASPSLLQSLPQLMFSVAGWGISILLAVVLVTSRQVQITGPRK